MQHTLTLSVWRRRYFRPCNRTFPLDLYFKLSASCLQRGSGTPSPGWAMVMASAVETMSNVSAYRRTAIGYRRGNTAVLSASSAEMIEGRARARVRHDLRRLPDREGFYLEKRISRFPEGFTLLYYSASYHLISAVGRIGVSSYRVISVKPKVIAFASRPSPGMKKRRTNIRRTSAASE